KNNPGCELFAARVTDMLNLDLRPVTAKWDRARVEGRLDSRDGADEFRGDLARVQVRLQAFAEDLHFMAYGQKLRDAQTPPALSPVEFHDCFKPVPFGITTSPAPREEKKINDEKTIKAISDAEAKAVKTRQDEKIIND